MEMLYFACVYEHALIGALPIFSFILPLNSASSPTLGVCVCVCVCYLGLNRFIWGIAIAKRKEETHIPKTRNKQGE